MEVQNCEGCEDSLRDDWVKKFPGITYCALCVEQQPEQLDTDIFQECSCCGTLLANHHQIACPICDGCDGECGHMIAYSPILFGADGPQLLGREDSKGIERLVEAHEKYGTAFWDAMQRIGDDEKFLTLWADLQDKNSDSLKAIYGDDWKFEDHDKWASGSYEWETLVILLGEIDVCLVDNEGGGAAGACWESKNVYAGDREAALKLANQNADKCASNLQDITSQIAKL